LHFSGFSRFRTAAVYEAASAAARQGMQTVPIDELAGTLVRHTSSFRLAFRLDRPVMARFKAVTGLDYENAPLYDLIGNPSVGDGAEASTS
jgi:hypothetical protein